MINIEFDSSKISVLLHTIMMYGKMSRSSNENDWNYSLSPAKSCDFIQLLNNPTRLGEILSNDELKVCQNILFNKEFKNQTLLEALFSGYDALDDSNYKEIINRCISEFEEHGFELSISKQVTDLFHIIDKLLNTPEFSKLYKETLEYKEQLSKNWENNKEKISNFVGFIIGNNNDKHIKVMVLPPIFDEGITTQGSNRDVYFSRCHDDRKNHEIMELVYLTHESMHSQILPYEEGQSLESVKNLHGFIQYLCDNELCARLCNEQGITYTYGENQQHHIKDETFKNMYPFFIGYMCRNTASPLNDVRKNMERNPNYSKEHGVSLYSPSKIIDFFKSKKNLTPYDFAELDFDLLVEKLKEKPLSKEP